MSANQKRGGSQGVNTTARGENAEKTNQTTGKTENKTQNRKDAGNCR